MRVMKPTSVIGGMSKHQPERSLGLVVQGFSRLMTRPADMSGGFQNLVGRVGSDQEVLQISRDEWGWVRGFSILAGPDGLPSLYLTREKPWRIGLAHTFTVASPPRYRIDVVPIRIEHPCAQQVTPLRHSPNHFPTFVFLAARTGAPSEHPRHL